MFEDLEPLPVRVRLQLDPLSACMPMEIGMGLPILDLQLAADNAESYMYAIIYWKEHRRRGFVFAADASFEPEAEELARNVARTIAREVGVFVRVHRTVDDWRHVAAPKPK